jgi:hypothetical protein
MVAILNVDRVARLVGRWHPSDLAFVSSLHYEGDGASGGCELVIEFVACRRDMATSGWPADQGPRYKVKIRFLGVRDLNLKEFGGGVTQIMGFDITEIADRGWERINYLVEDYEDGRISFQCESVEILEAEELSCSS